jgi:CarD family transcriptional regulator
MTAKKTKAKAPAAAKRAKAAPVAKSKKAAKPAKAAAKPAVKKSQGKSVPVKKKTQVQAKKPVQAKAQAKKTPIVRKVEAKKTPEKKVVAPKKAETAVKQPATEKLNGQVARKAEAGKPVVAAKAVAGKPPVPAKANGTNGAKAVAPRSMTMASTPVRPPVVAVPGQPAIVVKSAPSAPPLTGAPRPSAAGESAKLATLIRASGFATGDHVVYPTHGVGRIVETETQTIAGQDLHLFVITFEKDRMTLRLPIAKVRTSGLRKLATRKEMLAALTRLKGRSRARRTMWSRRAQEYEAKINSGDPNSIAEVVRDLYRNAGQPDQSYSERQIYQAALDRLAREFAVIEKIDETTAAQRLEQMLRAA